MVGITLSPEQVQSAPPEVRRWLQQEIADTFDLFRAEPSLQAPARHLAGCTPEQAKAILALIQGMLPVVGVFFALGREPVALSSQGLIALRIDDIARHTHLQGTDLVGQCLEVIDTAFQRVSGQGDTTLVTLDGAGHCVLTDTTARRIRALWHEIAEARAAAVPGMPVEPAVAYAPQPFQPPYDISVAAAPAGTA